MYYHKYLIIISTRNHNFIYLEFLIFFEINFCPESHLICIHNEQIQIQNLLSISNTTAIASLSATDVTSFSAGYSVVVKSFALLSTVEMCKEILVVISELTKVFCNFLRYLTVDYPKYYSINAHKSCCYSFA